MDRKRKQWIFKGLLVIGLIWRWMPVWVIRDGSGVSRDESHIL